MSEKYYWSRDYPKSPQPKEECNHKLSPVPHPAYPDGYCIKCGMPFSQPKESTQDTTESTQEEWKDIFEGKWMDKWHAGDKGYDITVGTEIKQFISNLLQEERESVIRQIIKCLRS